MDGPAGSQNAWFPLGRPRCMESDFHSFFGRRFFSFFFDLGSILGGFGRPKRRPKSIFGRFFFGVFFECVSASIFHGFWEARNLKNSNFPQEKQ